MSPWRSWPCGAGRLQGPRTGGGPLTWGTDKCPTPGHNGGMNTPNFETFAQQARAAGFDEVIERHWEPLTVLDTHTHPFAVQALVTQGQLWLTVQGQTRELRAGDRFELERDVPHEERYGPEGATYWVARRH